jgi:CubicO group peptidase (beta-lactamase class C family)
LIGALVQAPTAKPGNDWERAKPEAEGYSSKRLDVLKAYLATIDTTAMLVVHNGKVIFEYGDVTSQSNLASVRKSLLALLYGKYVANGKIDLDATLEELGIDDVGGLLPIEKRAKVRDVISARSGVFHKNTNPNGGDDVGVAPPRGTVLPGSFFLYNNWDFNVAGYVFEKQSGLDIFEAFRKEIAEPIGMQDFNPALQRKENDDQTLSKFPAYRFSLSTRDMARVGQLMLQNGKWNGQQVVPADWIKTITSLVTPVEQLNPPGRRYYGDGFLWGYGYLWWVWDDHHNSVFGSFQGAYTAMGNGGQFITVLPSVGLVIAHRVGPGDGQARREVLLAQYHGALRILLNSWCEQSGIYSCRG